MIDDQPQLLMKSTKIPPSILPVQTTAKPAPSHSQRDQLQNRCSGCHPEITPKQAKRRRKAIPLIPKLCELLGLASSMLFIMICGRTWMNSQQGWDSVMEDILDTFPCLLSSPMIESLRKDDGSFNLEARASLLKLFATDNIHLIGESSRILGTL